MKKNRLYFNIYIENELENDIELVGSADNMEALSFYFQRNKSRLYDLGVKKVKGLRIHLNIDGEKYLVIVDKD
jgi:hypothetical protein